MLFPGLGANVGTDVETEAPENTFECTYLQGNQSAKSAMVGQEGLTLLQKLYVFQ
jgi:hypothetical protein